MQLTRLMDMHQTPSTQMMESHRMHYDKEHLHQTLSQNHAILPNPPQQSIQTHATGIQNPYNILVPIEVTLNAESIKACSNTPTFMLPNHSTPGTFQEHVLQLDPWEYSLLPNVTLTQDPFAMTLIFMSQASPLQATTDGPPQMATGHLVG